ncbi:MAG: SH3 domain-containing protein [Verrucomicrobia bacterium]|nr:SH3 domain-containing protein [Verrucomicrobiota bacterium]
MINGNRNLDLRLKGLALVAMLSTSAAVAQAPSPEIRVTLAATPATVYVGQPFQILLTVHARGITLGNEFGLDGLNGGQQVALGQFQELTPTRTSAGGQIEETRQFRSESHGINPGAVNLAPTLRFTQLTHERTVFGTTTFQSTRSTPVTPVAVTVIPLPTAGRPDDFSGAIGQFTLDLDATPTDLAVGDLVTLTMTIRGNGRLAGVTSPTLDHPDAFKTYPPQQAADAAPGTVRFEQTVIPQSTNAVATPAARFTFFDTTAGVYRTLLAPPVPLHFHARDSAPSFSPYRPESSPGGATNGSIAPVTSAAPEQTTPDWRGATGVLSLRVLLSFATGIAWLLATGLALANLWSWHKRRAAAISWRAALVALLFGGACFAGTRYVVNLTAAGLLERTLSTSTPARIAPASAARELVIFPQGTPVTITETWNGWSRVVQGDAWGWIPSESLTSSDSPTER